MNKQTSVIRAGAVCAVIAAVILIGMVVVGGRATEYLAILGQPGTPAQYTDALRPVAEVVLQMMALDNIFLIAYTGAFIGAAALVWKRTRLFGVIGLGCAVLLALLDITENSVTVDMARAVQGGVPIPEWEIAALGLLEQMKYANGAMAVVFFAVGLLITFPQGRLAKVVAVLFLFFPVTNAVKVIGTNELLLIFWMLVMLVLSAILLWRESRPVK